MSVMQRWLVIHMQRPEMHWPSAVPTEIKAFTALKPAERLAHKLAQNDDEENDYVIIWDLALDRVTHGPF